MTIRRQLEIASQDLRYAVRGFRRAPVFTFTAVFAVALAAGTGTAVFSVVDRILFRGLPYAEAGRLVSFGMTAPIEPEEFMLGSDWIEWRVRQTPFSAVASWTGLADCDLTESNPVRLVCAHVDAALLPALGVRPILGRSFTPDEDKPRAPKVVILSYGLWKRRFGGDPGVTGRSIPLDGKPARILGVLPPDFEVPVLGPADVIVPQALDEAAQRRPNTGRVLGAIGRLKPGLTPAQAVAALQPLFQESLQFVPAQFRKEVNLRVRSLRDRQIQDARLASWILLGAVLAVLLIACANVANLLLARGAARRRELSVRAALGAGRPRLARQLLTESLTLAAAGGAVGCVLAAVLLRFFIAIAPQGIPRLQQASIDLRVLLFALSVSLLCGLLFGLAPALHLPRGETLAGWRTVGPAAHLFRHALAAAQICASLVLLTGATLLLRSLWNLQNQPLGIRTGSVLAATVTLGQQSYPDPARRLRFLEDLESRMRRIPGVAQVAVSDSLPPAGPTRSMIYAAIEVRGRPSFRSGTGGMVTWRYVTPGYFDALGIPILRGRPFEEEDRNPNRDVVILSDLLARRLFPGEKPLGKRIQPGRSGPWLEVIGVAANVKNTGLAERGGPEYYRVRKHMPDPNIGRTSTIILRGSVERPAMARWVRSEVAALDPTLPVNIETLRQRIGKLAMRPRFIAFLLGLFAGIGLLLAVIGLYGVISFLVAQRTREMGVRMALGATPRAVILLVLGHAVRWTVIGALAGLAGSIPAARVLQAMLFQIPTSDPAAPASAAAVLLATGMLAAWLPARRAARIHPVEALHHD